MAIELLNGNPQELWAKKEVRANLKQIINKKNITVDENGKVAGKSSKRNCLSQLFHKFKMRSTESKYFKKQLNFAIKAYNQNAEAINAKAQVTLVDTTKIQEEINTEKKKIEAADVLLAQNVKAKGDLLAPVKAKQETLATALTQVGISADDVKTIIGKNNEIAEHTKKDAALDKETAELNASNEALFDKYATLEWGIYGIRTFNQNGDKEASIKKIQDAKYTPKVTKALIEDVSKNIDNNARLAAIVVEKKDTADLIIDLNSDIQDIVKAAVATPEGKTWNDCVALYKEIEAIENNEVRKVAISALEAQINAANAAKAAANAQIAKLNDQLPKTEAPVAKV